MCSLFRDSVKYIGLLARTGNFRATTRRSLLWNSFSYRGSERNSDIFWIYVTSTEDSCPTLRTLRRRWTNSLKWNTSLKSRSSAQNTFTAFETHNRIALVTLHRTGFPNSVEPDGFPGFLISIWMWPVPSDQRWAAPYHDLVSPPGAEWTNYSVIEKKFLAFVYALMKLRPYLQYKHFLIRTDKC